VRFPLKWELDAVLIDSVRIADPSVLSWNGAWYIFGLERDSLRVYVADSLNGRWHQHPRSPIAWYVDNSRPAGRIVVINDKPVRFAQDSHLGYGRAVNAFFVDKLDLESYSESPYPANPILAGSGSGWNEHGMHHIDIHRVNDSSWIACFDGIQEFGRSVSFGWDR
jgi:hypothetical protein